MENKYYGETNAINKNKTEAEKAMNRRVDIILWTDYKLAQRNKKPQVFLLNPIAILNLLLPKEQELKSLQIVWFMKMVACQTVM
ncbi:MAG: hypothetical protein IPI65_15700 [Bacteroidetes bacterium]|nr:hypothetical protein [Bacteroidota bacterium]